MTTTHQLNVRQGVDLAVLEQFAAFADEHPADVQFGLEAVGQYEGRAAHTTSTTGPYTLGGERIDRPALHPALRGPQRGRGGAGLRGPHRSRGGQ